MAREQTQSAYPSPVHSLLSFLSFLLTQSLIRWEHLLAQLPTSPPLFLHLTNVLDISIKLPLFLILTLPPITLALFKTFFALGLLVVVDLGLTLGNLFSSPLKGPPKGHPSKGEAGRYPPAMKVEEGCARGPCPALNALANHGIVAHSGRKIPLEELHHAIRTTFNCSETFTKFAIEAMRKQYGRDWINLSDLGAHNVIEHDASLLRHDTFFVPDQAQPAPDLTSALLNPHNREVPSKLSIYDISRFQSLRRAQTLATNPHAAATLSPKHALFGSNNASLLLVIWGGDVEAIRRFLDTETFEDGWVTAARSRFGATFLEFNLISLRLELSTQLDQIRLPSQLSNLSNPSFKEIKWSNLTANKASARGVNVFGVIGSH